MKRRREGFPLDLPPQIVHAQRATSRNPRVRLTLLRSAPELPKTKPGPVPADNGHVYVAVDLLARAAAATSVSAQGDALLVAMEHVARALGVLFDREAVRQHLARVANGL